MENDTTELRQRLDHYRTMANQAIAERGEKEIHLAVLHRRRDELTKKWETIDVPSTEGHMLWGEILGLCYAIGVVAS